MPERADFIPALQAQIPQLEIVRDTQRVAMATFLTALETCGADAAVLLEDDIILTRDFPAKAEAAIAERPDMVINFFSYRDMDRQLGSRWMPRGLFSWTQCFYLPPGYARGLIDYYPHWPQRRNMTGGQDWLIRGYLGELGEGWWCHVPSLVQHRRGRSAIDPRRSSRRQSPTFQL